MLAIVVGMRHADPNLKLACIAVRLEQMRERTQERTADGTPTARILLQQAYRMGIGGTSP